MRVVGISSSPDGVSYGTYTTTLQQGYKACVLIRCPTNSSGYTDVDLRIAYINSSQCSMRSVIARINSLLTYS